MNSEPSRRVDDGEEKGRGKKPGRGKLEGRRSGGLRIELDVEPREEVELQTEPGRLKVQEQPREGMRKKREAAGGGPSGSRRRAAGSDRSPFEPGGERRKERRMRSSTGRGSEIEKKMQQAEAWLQSRRWVEASVMGGHLDDAGREGRVRRVTERESHSFETKWLERGMCERALVGALVSRSGRHRMAPLRIASGRNPPNTAPRTKKYQRVKRSALRPSAAALRLLR